MKLLPVIFAVAALAQSGMEIPSIGAMRDAWGIWHSVQGIAGSFVLGPVVEEPGAAPDSHLAIEQRGDVFFIVAPDGSTVDALPRVARQPILLIGETPLYSTGKAIVIGNARIPCPGVTALRRMSPEWVQVTASNREYALRIEPGRETLFLLPAAHPPEVRRR
jgi:hypothetical protein